MLLQIIHNLPSKIGNHKVFDQWDTILAELFSFAVLVVFISIWKVFRPKYGRSWTLKFTDGYFLVRCPSYGGSKQSKQNTTGLEPERYTARYTGKIAKCVIFASSILRKFSPSITVRHGFKDEWHKYHGNIEYIYFFGNGCMVVPSFFCPITLSPAFCNAQCAS